VHVGVAAGARPGAQRGIDSQRCLGSLGGRLQRVELLVEFVGRAPEHRGGLATRRLGEVVARVRELGVRVQAGAVVDPDRVDGLVFDDGAVHEGAGVAQRGVVQLRAGDALGDGGGELRGDVVHVGEPVCERDRQLALDGPFGDACADRLRQGELTAQVVGLDGADAEV